MISGDIRMIGSALIAFLLTACVEFPSGPSTLSSPDQYVRIGVLPGFPSEAIRGGDHLKIDFGVNDLVMDRVQQSLKQTNHELVDLRSFTDAYVATRKIDTVNSLKSLVGDKGLDAYLVIDGYPVSMNTVIGAPAGFGDSPSPPPPIMQLFSKSKSNVLSQTLNIYVVDGRTFQIAAAYHESLVMRGFPDAWYASPDEHVDEIKNGLAYMLDYKLGVALQKLGLIGSAQHGLSFEFIHPGLFQKLAPAGAGMSG